MFNKIVLSIALMTTLAGCHFERMLVDVSKCESKAIRTESMLRYYFTLENTPESEWSVKSDDSDAEITQDLNYETGNLEVRVRIHRGFDGPAHVTCTRKNRQTRKVEKDFTLMFFKDTSDRAFWE